MKKSGVLLIGNFLSSHTGTRSVCEELSLRLSERGWKTIESSHQLGRIFRLVEMLSSVIVYRKEYQVACVDVYSGLAFFWAEMVVWALSLLRKPIILILRGGGLVEFAQRHSLRVSRFLRQGQIIITPSLFLQAGLKPYSPAIRYLPNAVEVNHYEFQLRYHPSPKIIWLRAFHKIYQPELAIKAISFLTGELKEISLIMIGPDKKDGSLPSVLKLAEALGVASIVDIAGSVPKSEVPMWLKKGDIFLNTTCFESFGVSVLEAALIGLPIVTTDVGELSYLWENEKTAMLVPPNDHVAMAVALKRILTEPELAQLLSKNARRKAEQFDWSVILPEWEALFEKVIDA